MPSSTAILQGLTAIANEWRPLATAWHVAFAIVALAMLAGWRPAQRLLALLVTAPLVSVSALAWHAGNPFNGTLFAVLAVVLFVHALRLPTDPIAVGFSPRLVAGAILLGFAWAYPHFLHASSWTAYLYAAPLGLIPCPTLSALAGVSLIAGSFGSKAWAKIVASAGVLYGLIGVVALGVAIDAVLVAGAVILAGSAFHPRRIVRRPLDTSQPWPVR